MKRQPRIVVDIADRQSCLRLDRQRLRRAVRAALAGTEPRQARISLAVVDDAPAGFVGTMTTVLLVSNMLAGKVMGWLGDRRGPRSILTAACASGAAAAAIALWMPNYLWGFPMFVLVSLASQGVYLSGSLAAIGYSHRVRTPLYSSVIGLVSSPVYIAASLLGGLLSKQIGLRAVFAAALAVYALCAVLSALPDRPRE